MGLLRFWLLLLLLLAQPAILQGRWMPCRLGCLRRRRSLHRQLRLLHLRLLLWLSHRTHCWLQPWWQQLRRRAGLRARRPMQQGGTPRAQPLRSTHADLYSAAHGPYLGVPRSLGGLMRLPLHVELRLPVLHRGVVHPLLLEDLAAAGRLRAVPGVLHRVDGPQIARLRRHQRFQEVGGGVSEVSGLGFKVACLERYQCVHKVGGGVAEAQQED